MSEITYTIECLPEDCPVRGNFATGDAVQDREIEDQIIADLDNGNPWAWCTVKVTARIEGINLVGVDYLGCCSYRDQADFEACMYFADMKAQANNDLIAQIEVVKAVQID